MLLAGRWPPSRWGASTRRRGARPHGPRTPGAAAGEEHRPEGPGAGRPGTEGSRHGGGHLRRGAHLEDPRLRQEAPGGRGRPHARHLLPRYWSATRPRAAAVPVPASSAGRRLPGRRQGRLCLPTRVGDSTASQALPPRPLQSPSPVSALAFTSFMVGLPGAAAAPGGCPTPAWAGLLAPCHTPFHRQLVGLPLGLSLSLLEGTQQREGRGARAPAGLVPAWALPAA